jgi:tetratricopeptide (TPR) repeat protein
LTDWSEILASASGHRDPAVSDKPASAAFLFDPEIDDPRRDVLFELIIAGTWEKAFRVLEEHREITESQAFWTWVKEQLPHADDEVLRMHLAGQCLISVRYFTGDLSQEEFDRLGRFPKPRAQGDLETASRMYSQREAAIAAGDTVLEMRILREVASIDPCAAPLWYSLAATSLRAGNQSAYERSLGRFVLSVTADLDIGLFALKRGVHKAARTYLERCLNTLQERGDPAPPIAVSALTALGTIHGDLAQYDAAVACFRRACELAEAASGANGTTGRFPRIEIVRLRTSLCYATIRAGQLDQAEELLEATLATTAVSAAEDAPDQDEWIAAHARVLLALGDVARRRGHDDRAIDLLTQGIERLGLRMTRDGRLFNTGGEPWRADPGSNFAEMTTAVYPDPKPESFDPHNTWFADIYENLVSLMKAAAGAAEDYPAELDANLLRVAMAPSYSTQRGKALSRVGTQLWRLGQYERSEEALRAALVQYQETESGWSAIADSKHVLAEVLLATGRAAEALEFVNAAIDEFHNVHDLEPLIISISLAQSHYLRARVRASLTESATGADRAVILEDARTAADYLKGGVGQTGVRATSENIALLLIALGAFSEAAELLVRAGLGARRRISEICRCLEFPLIGNRPDGQPAEPVAIAKAPDRRLDSERTLPAAGIRDPLQCPRDVDVGVS